MLSKEENKLIKIQSLFFFTSSLADIFLQVFIFKHTELKTVVLFDLIILIFLLTLYLSSGWTLKVISSRTLIRGGLSLFSLGWGLIVILQERLVSFIIPLGVIFGIAHGMYWSGYNLSQYILTHKKSRTRFFGKSGALTNLAKSIGPAIGGTIILSGNKLFQNVFAGYYILFFIVSILNLGNLLLSSTLPRHSDIGFSIRHLIKHKRKYNWKSVLTQQFLLGIWDVAFGTLSGILLFLILKQESLLGIYKTAAALLTAAASLVAGRILNRYKKAYFLGSLLITMGIISFAMMQNLAGVVFLGLFMGIGGPFLNIPLSTAILDTADEYQEPWRNKYHLLLEKDFSLGIARILNYAFLLFFFTSKNQMLIARQWMIAISIIPLILGMLLSKMKPNI